MPLTLDPTLLYALLAAAAGFYGTARLLTGTHMTKVAVWSTAALVAVAAASHYCLGYTELTFEEKTVNYWYPVTALFVVFAIAAAFWATVRDAILLARRLMKRETPEKDVFSLMLSSIAVVLVLAGGVLAGWNALTAPLDNDETVEIAGLPAPLDGLRVAVLDDLQLSPLTGAEGAQAAVDAVNALNADLILVTGDAFSGRPSERRTELLKTLAGLAAKYGVVTAVKDSAFVHAATGLPAVQPGVPVTVIVRDVPVTVTAGDSAATNAGLTIACTEIPEAAPEAQLVLVSADPAAQVAVVRTFAGAPAPGLTAAAGRAPVYVSQGAAVLPDLPLRQGTFNEITVLTLKAK